MKLSNPIPKMQEYKNSPKSLLDSGFLPVEELAVLAQREGRRPVPIYQAHKWFARRFSSAFRAILTAGGMEKEGDFWAAFYNGIDYSGKTVLDPFVGGGTSVVEAALLGAHTVGIDIDPVACAITRFELRAGDTPALASALEQLQESVGKRMARYYRTLGPEGEKRQILHSFWVQFLNCGNCGTELEAHPHYRLAFEAEGKHQWAFCRFCHHVHELPRSQESFSCQECGLKTNISEGTMDYGKITCTDCHYTEPLIQLSERTNKPPEWRLFALETIPEGPPKRRMSMNARHFQRARDEDRTLVQRAAKAYKRLQKEHKNWIPERFIPAENRSDDRLIRYGYKRYRELFNDRQLLHLALLAEAIAQLDGPTREALSLAFSDHLTTNCMLTHYAFGWRRLAPLFSIRAYRHVVRPVEINPWLDGTGRGTFPNAVRQVERATAFARAPKVAHLDGGFVDISPLNARNPQIHQGDSRLMQQVKRNSVDLILTDPPYCDNIAYSELSDFFLPWLQGFDLASPDANTAQELSDNLAAISRDQTSVTAFKDGLSLCFQQLRRVLKNDGRLVFSYQHRTPQAWEALASALQAGGWQPIQVFPLLGNTTAGLHQHDGTILWDAVIVCRKSTSKLKSLSLTSKQLEAANAMVEQWHQRLSPQSAIHFRMADKLNLHYALIVAASLGMFGTKTRAKSQPLYDVLATIAHLP